MKIKYRPDIDGLRAVAVLVVMLYHGHLFFTGGYVGVDVFFVISGYLITQLLMNQLTDKGRVSLNDFYVRRFRRLLPAIFFLIVICIALWFKYLLGVSEETEHFIKSIKYSLIGIANIFFFKNAGGYFNGASDEMPLLHFWSLSVEEQFYLVFPILITLITRIFSHHSIDHLSKIIANCLLFLLLTSFISSVYLTTSGQHKMAFFLMPFRIWELGIGCILALKSAQIERIFEFFSSSNKIFSEFLALIALAMILIPSFLYDETTLFPGFAAMPPTFGAAILICAGAHRNPPQISKLLSSKVFVNIGLLSYGLYLWHWPLLAMAKLHNLGEIPDIKMRVLILVLSVIVAKFSLEFIEKPIRYKNIISQPLTVFGSAAVGVLLLVMISKGVGKYEAAHYPPSMEAQTIVEDPALFKGCWGKDFKNFPAACTADFSNGKLRTPHIVVWGNSHAISYLPMFEKFVQKNHLILSAYSQGDGNFGAVYPDDLLISGWIKQAEKHTADGREANAFVVSQIKEMVKVGSVNVVLASRWAFYGGASISIKERGMYFLDKEKTRNGSVAMLEKTLRLTIQTLSSLGVSHILIPVAYPEFKYSFARCGLRRFEQCSTPRSTMDTYKKPIVDILQKIVKDYPNVKIFNPVDLLCDSNTCPPTITMSGKQFPIASDSNHPSITAARYLGDKISDDLKWLISN